MLINGKRTDITKEDLLKSAKAMKIKEDKAIVVRNDVKKSLLKWKEFAIKAHLDDLTINSVEKMFILF